MTAETLESVKAAAEDARSAARREADGAWLRDSYLGRAGRTIEPAFAPIGWDWKVDVAVLSSFPAREVVVGVLGVLYDLGDDEEQSDLLRDRIRNARWESGPRTGQRVFDLASALALMVFFALCMQCVSTLSVMRKETGTWLWPAFAFTYLTVLAYVGALATAWITRSVMS
jgi:ferrous iron transport protein B